MSARFLSRHLPGGTGTPTPVESGLRVRSGHILETQGEVAN